SGTAEDDRPATALLDNFEAADVLVLRFASDTPLQPVTWEHALQQVWIPAWEKQMQYQRDALRGMTMVNLPEQLRSAALARRLRNPEGRLLDLAERDDMARGVAACALSLVLLRQGWTFHLSPGRAYCEKDGQTLV